MTIRIICPFQKWTDSYNYTMELSNKAHKKAFVISREFSSRIYIRHSFLTAIYIPMGTSAEIQMYTNMDYKKLGTFDNNVEYSLEEALSDYHQILEYPNVLNDENSFYAGEELGITTDIYKLGNTQCNVFINGTEYERIVPFVPFFPGGDLHIITSEVYYVELVAKIFSPNTLVFCRNCNGNRQWWRKNANDEYPISLNE